MVEKSVCTEVDVKDFVGVEEEVKDLDPTGLAASAYDKPDGVLCSTIFRASG